MKKGLSLVLVLMMVFSLALPTFAGKPPWAGKGKGEENEYEYKNVLNKDPLPPGLAKKDVLPYGLRKDMSVSVGMMEELIETVEEYLKGIDPDMIIDDDDDTLPTGDEEDLVDAIEDLIARIEFELSEAKRLEETPDLGRYYFMLEKKFEILQKVYGEVEEEVSYEGIINEIKLKLEEVIELDLVPDPIDEDEVPLQDILDDIAELEAMEDYEYTLEDYESIKADADYYLDILKDYEAEITEEDIEALRAEIAEFLPTVEGLYKEPNVDSIGEYDFDTFKALLGRYLDYKGKDFDEDLEAYYNDLDQMFKESKMTKLVVSDDLGDYVTLFDSLLDEEDLLPEQINDINEMKVLLEAVIEDGFTTLETYDDLENQASELYETIANYQTPEEKLTALLEEANNLYDAAYPELDGTEVIVEKATLLVAIEDAQEVLVETDPDYETAYDALLLAVDNFKTFITQ